MLKTISFTFIAYFIYVVFGQALIAEHHYGNYLKLGDIAYLKQAMDADAKNTLYALSLAQRLELPDSNKYIGIAYEHNNGDVTGWTLMLIKGHIALRSGNVMEARECYKKAVYYNPNDKKLREVLEDIEKVIELNDRIVVKFR